MDELLRTFGIYQRKADSMKESVTKILDKIEAELNSGSYPLCKGAQFVGTGGSYEGTAVTNEADFDIAVVLPEPFKGENFEAIQFVGHPGIYKLKAYKKELFDDVYITEDGFLRTKLLSCEIFSELRRAINASVSGVLRMKETASAIKTTILSNKIDFVPQIKFPANSVRLPGWEEDSIPKEVSISYDKKFVLFNLTHPPNLRSALNSSLMLQPSFSLIEAEILKKIEKLRDCVRITKHIAKNKNWYRYGLRSYHIKRTAIRKRKEIDDQIDLTNGVRIILKSLENDLSFNKIPGCFIKDQNVFHGRTSEALYLETNIKSCLMKENFTEDSVSSISTIFMNMRLLSIN